METRYSLLRSPETAETGLKRLRQTFSVPRPLSGLGFAFREGAGDFVPENLDRDAAGHQNDRCGLRQSDGLSQEEYREEGGNHRFQKEHVVGATGIGHQGKTAEPEHESDGRVPDSDGQNGSRAFNRTVEQGRRIDPDAPEKADDRPQREEAEREGVGCHPDRAVLTEIRLGEHDIDRAERAAGEGEDDAEYRGFFGDRTEITVGDQEYHAGEGAKAADDFRGRDRHFVHDPVHRDNHDRHRGHQGGDLNDCRVVQRPVEEQLRRGHAEQR